MSASRVIGLNRKNDSVFCLCLSTKDVSVLNHLDELVECQCLGELGRDSSDGSGRP